MMIINGRGIDGNAFNIMGYVKQYLERTGQEDQIEEANKRMMSGDYSNLCDVAEEVTNGAVKVVNRP